MVFWCLWISLNIYFLEYVSFFVKNVKRIVHQKIKITPQFTHPHAILGVYDFLLSGKYNQSYIKNGLGLPGFIIAVNSGQV